MNKLILKIYSYDETKDSLIVSFASDETKSQNPDDYEKLNYNPMGMFPDITDMTLVPKMIAVAGIYHTQQQVKKEKLSNDPNQINILKNLENQVFEFNASDLTPAA
jgi:hypothetical protein